MRSRVSDPLREQLAAMDEAGYPEWFELWRKRLSDAADDIDGNHAVRMRQQKDIVTKRACKDMRYFLNGYERNMRRRYLLEDVLNGDAEMYVDSRTDEIEELLKAYGSAVELNAMIKGLRDFIHDDADVDISDMLVRSELVCAAIRSAITNMAGGRDVNNVIYRNADDTIPLPLQVTDIPRTASEISGQRYEYATTTKSRTDA